MLLGSVFLFWLPENQRTGSGLHRVILLFIQKLYFYPESFSSVSNNITPITFQT